MADMNTPSVFAHSDEDGLIDIDTGHREILRGDEGLSVSQVVGAEAPATFCGSRVVRVIAIHRMEDDQESQAVYTFGAQKLLGQEVKCLPKRVVPRGGIEPPTLRFSVACSTN